MIAIINGKIVRDVHKEPTKHHDQFKQYRYETQRIDHKADIIQPYDHNGNPNPEFIHVYKDRAVDYFGEENVRKYGNL